MAVAACAARRSERAALPNFARNATFQIIDEMPTFFAFWALAAELPTVFAHELFHFYQTERDDRLFTALWVEGLAVYASLGLVANATIDVALPISHLHDPQHPSIDIPSRRVALEEAMPRFAKGLGNELLAVFNSTDSTDYATFFLGRASPRLMERPVRSAYWFGLQIARKLARGRDLAVLARVPPASREAEIRACVEEIVAAS